MVLVQLIKRKLGLCKWNVLNTNDQDVIEIQTWKGNYSISNPNPHSGHTPFLCEVFPLWVMERCERQDMETCAMCRGIGQKFYLFHPFKQEWVMDYHVGNIENDIREYILAQPPQLDQMQAAYEEDRETVEKEFVEIDVLSVTR